MKKYDESVEMLLRSFEDEVTIAQHHGESFNWHRALFHPLKHLKYSTIGATAFWSDALTQELNLLRAKKLELKKQKKENAILRGQVAVLREALEKALGRMETMQNYIKRTSHLSKNMYETNMAAYNAGERALEQTEDK